VRKLSALCRPFLVRLLDICDPDIEERARLVRIGRRGQGDGGLVVGRAAALVEDEPRIRDLHDDRVTLDEDLAIEERLIERPRTILVRDHEVVMRTSFGAGESSGFTSPSHARCCGDDKASARCPGFGGEEIAMVVA